MSVFCLACLRPPDNGFLFCPKHFESWLASPERSAWAIIKDDPGRHMMDFANRTRGEELFVAKAARGWHPAAQGPIASGDLHGFGSTPLHVMPHGGEQ